MNAISLERFAIQVSVNAKTAKTMTSFNYRAPKSLLTDTLNEKEELVDAFDD